MSGWAVAFMCCAALLLLSFILIVALAALVLIVATASRTLVAEKELLEKDLVTAENVLDNLMQAMGGPLFEQLTRMKAADVSLVYDNEVSALYRNLTNLHRYIYQNISNYREYRGEAPLPPYAEDANTTMERMHLNAQKKTIFTADFKQKRTATIEKA